MSDPVAGMEPSPPESASPQPSSAAPSLPVPPTAPPPTDPSPTATDERGGDVCEQVEFERLQQVIEGQQTALASRDFDAALAFASESFRGSVGVPQFRMIIEGSYAFLLGDPDLDFTSCLYAADAAVMAVEVSGSRKVVIVYRMVREDSGWFIDGASVAGMRTEIAA